MDLSLFFYGVAMIVLPLALLGLAERAERRASR